jgi:phenylacetate-CoA ligase
MIHIREAQIVQCAPGMVNVLIVRGKSFNESDEQRLRQEFMQRVGKDTELKLEYVDELQRTNAGKLRFVISEIKDNRVEAVAGSPGGKVAS